MNVLGIIPARYGSTRLEGKPLLKIGDKTMIQRVYEQAKKILSHVIVATDDERIEKVVQQFGGEVVMTSSKHTTGTNRCLEAYEVFTKNNNDRFDVIVNIQGDEPLLDPEQIRTLISCFSEENTEMATLVMPVKNTKDLMNGGVFVVIDRFKNALYFSRAVIPFVRDIPKKDWHTEHLFYKHIGMYGFKPKALKEFASLQQTSLERAESLEQNRWLENGKNIKVEITEIKSLAVDTQDDLEMVRKIIKKQE